MYFDIALHYHTTIKVKQHEQKPTLKKGYYNRPPPPPVSYWLRHAYSKVNHGYPMVTKPLNLGRVTGYSKCMYGNLRYPTLSRVTYWNCTCEVVRGSSLLPALLAAVLTWSGSPLSAGFIIWAMSGWFCFSRRIRVISRVKAAGSSTSAFRFR